MKSVDGHERDDEVRGGAEHGGQRRQHVHVHVHRVGVADTKTIILVIWIKIFLASVLCIGLYCILIQHNIWL